MADDLWKSVKAFQRGHNVSLSEVLVLDSVKEDSDGVYRYDIGKEAFQRISSAVSMSMTTDHATLPSVQACVIRRMDDMSLVCVKSEGREYAEQRTCLHSRPAIVGGHAYLLTHYAITSMQPEQFPSSANWDARLACERVVLQIQKGMRCRLEIQDFGSGTLRYKVAIELDDTHTDGKRFAQLMQSIGAATV